MKGIRCIYTDNLDITRIANDVESTLKKNCAKIPSLKQELKKKQVELGEKITYNKYRTIQDEINSLQRNIDDIDKKAQKYRTEIDPVIERWKKCSYQPNSCYITDIDTCIEEFANITNKYIPVTIIRTQSSPEGICSFCNSKSLEENLLTQTIYCTSCKQERTVLSSTGGKDVGEDSSGIDEDGVETDRIDQMLNRFQGKQAPLPANVYTEIENYLNSRGIVKQSELRERIRKNPESRHGTSRLLMEEAIKATGNEKFYKDLHLICAVIWGWDLPSFPPELEQQIISDYNLTQKFYPQLREDRRSRLNSDFRIVRHLLTRGYYHPVMKECKIAATQDVLDFHEKIWSNMCRKANLPYVPLSI